jgi:hypothetical protein
MKKRKHTPPTDDSAEPSEAMIQSADAVRVSEVAGEIPSLAAPRISASVPSIDSLDPQRTPEAITIEAPQARREPGLPRAATLGPAPRSAPHVETPVPDRNAITAAAAGDAPRPRRFALLAVCLALCASLGALGGSLAVAGVGHLLAAAPPPAPPAHGEASEEIRALKESIAQLRGNLKTIGDNVAAVRAGLNASFSSSTAQFAKLAEAIEKLEHHQAERHAAAPPAAAPAAPAETTGSIASAPATKAANPGVVEGWVLRKAYRGAALVEGRYGIIEIEPGDHLPGVGRVEEIKRQDGRWVVVTPKGLIQPAQ